VRSATNEGTSRYKDRFQFKLHPTHFSLHNDLWFSSLGVGVYLNEADTGTASLCQEAVISALQLGCNYIDTSFSYKSLRSEEIVGQALGAAFARGIVSRDEVIVSARGGAIYFEGEYPTDAALFVRRNLIETRMAAIDEFAHSWHHCISPRYIRKQFRQTLTNLGLGTLDIYFLHNPEVQRTERGPQIFGQRLMSAFVELEAQIETERLAYYGLATIDGFRVPPNDPAYLSLEHLVELAENAGGPNHHFRYVSAPLNLAKRELLEFKNQVVKGREMTLLEAANELNVVVIGTEALWHGELAWHVPDDVRLALPEAETNAQAALQFARSVPGLASAVVGMSKPKQVQENTAVARWPLIPSTQLATLL
jgi:aryl-alcohol dehydrogenase-like predicted oxidoreductase